MTRQRIQTSVCARLGMVAWLGALVLSGWCAAARADTGTLGDASVVGVGYNYYGQCDVSGWTDVTQVSGGGYHSLGLKSDGSVVAVGYNSSGQCNVSGWTDVTQVSGGYLHSLGLKSDGSVVAVGDNSYGQCNVLPAGYYLAVSAGDYHSLGLRARDSYEDLLVTGMGNDALLQAGRSITVSGDATIETTMTMAMHSGVANPTITVGGLVTIQADAGVSGGGTIAGEVWAKPNSRIQATGDLTLGDAASVGGFVGEGRVEVGNNTVTINSRMTVPVGQTVLIDGGTLDVANGMIIEPGCRLIGTGAVAGAVVNQGLIAAGGAGDELTFNDLVTGAGSFTGSVVFNGGFSPGNSPVSLHLDDVAFGGANVLTMELGGTQAGDEYDHLDILGSADLGGTLSVELLYGFAPEDGDVFDLFDGVLIGRFDIVALPALDAGLGWDTGDLYTAGQLTVVPEPATLFLLGIGAVGLIRRRRGA